MFGSGEDGLRHLWKQIVKTPGRGAVFMSECSQKLQHNLSEEIPLAMQQSSPSLPFALAGANSIALSVARTTFRVYFSLSNSASLRSTSLGKSVGVHVDRAAERLLGEHP